MTTHALERLFDSPMHVSIDRGLALVLRSRGRAESLARLLATLREQALRRIRARAREVHALARTLSESEVGSLLFFVALIMATFLI